jgi:hypothetical protein
VVFLGSTSPGDSAILACARAMTMPPQPPAGGIVASRLFESAPRASRCGRWRYRCDCWLTPTSRHGTVSRRSRPRPDSPAPPSVGAVPRSRLPPLGNRSPISHAGSARHAQPRPRHRRVDRVRELLDRPRTCRQFVSVDEHDEVVVGGGEHNRDTIPVRSAHVGGLVVAVVGIEIHGDAPMERLPGGALAHETVGDVAPPVVSTLTRTTKSQPPAKTSTKRQPGDLRKSCHMHRARLRRGAPRFPGVLDLIPRGDFLDDERDPIYRRVDVARAVTIAVVDGCCGSER